MPFTAPPRRLLGRLAAALAACSLVAGAQTASAAPPDAPAGASAAAAPEAAAPVAAPDATAPDATAPDAADTDGDGLLDVWERKGYDADNDGEVDVDLPGMGADPMHKDVFVEMDYMGAEATCPCHLPLASDLRRIVRIYADAPRAKNPDGTRGITMHLDAGSARGARYDLGGGNLVPHDDDLNPVDQQFTAIKTANFDADRAKIFHYMVWAHGYDGDTSSGLSFGIPASDFIVTLGYFPEHGTSDAKVGTFVHEIGHNFGLQHGGNDSVNYKPNYLSVMGYTFQIEGVPRTEGRRAYFGYSRARLPQLKEDRLAEPLGLDSRAARDYRTSWWCPNGAFVTSPGSADGPLDWDCSGAINGTVAADVNADSDLSTLTGARDWGHLVFDGGDIGVGGKAPISTARVPELTADQYERMTADR